MNTMKRELIAAVLAAYSAVCAGAGTIDLPQGRYCATTQVGDTYNGVTAGPCPTQPPIGNCPAGRALTTKLAHRYDVSDARVVDVTKADNVFGQFTWASPAHAFPWDQGYTVFVAMKRGEYIAAEFTVPIATPPAQRGTIYKGESVPGPANLVAISRNCGSFVPDTGTQFCTARTGSPGQAVMGYRLPSAAGAACVLTPGVRYYLNIKLADPLAVDPNCTATTCRFTLQNNHSP